MARTKTATAEPEVTFSNGTSGAGHKLADYIDSDVLLYRLGTTTVKSEFGENEATRAILVELCEWDDPSGPLYFVKGETYVFATVLQDALEESDFVLGTIAKPGRAFVLRALHDDQVSRLRAKWRQMWPELQAAANEAQDAYNARLADASSEGRQLEAKPSK